MAFAPPYDFQPIIDRPDESAAVLKRAANFAELK
jgi:hypothetical protein